MKTIRLFSIVVLLAASGSICQGAEDYFGRREAIDLARAAGNSTVLLMGDDHTQPAIKQFLDGELPSLHRLGFSCLAFEMLPVGFQDDLDTWSPESQERIQHHLQKAWGEKGAGIPEALFSVLKKAKEEGMRVIALDPPNASQLSRPEVNPYWNACIKHCLGKDCRMIVFAGRSHVELTSGSLSSLLQAEGISISMVQFAGLETQESAELDLRTARLLGRAAHPTTLLTLQGYQTGRRESFMTPCSTAHENESTWIVNLSVSEPFPPIQVACR